MKVSPETAVALNEKLHFVSLMKDFDDDFTGVYDRLVKKLWKEASIKDNDIRSNRPFPGLSFYSRPFTQAEIEDIALRKFARYMHYELGRDLKKELEVRAYNAHKGSQMEDWLHALDGVAEQITWHWGTPLKAVD